MAMDAGFARILVPTDFSEHSERAWGAAQRLARGLGSELVLVHVLVEVQLYEEGLFGGDRVREFYAGVRKWAEDRLDQWATTARAAGFSVRTDIRSGVPHQEIVAVAVDLGADLIVVGTHGRGGIERSLLGSVADRVIRTAPCPVLSVRVQSETDAVG
jgi:nucleotide-binding universal stress UspA family protein